MIPDNVVFQRTMGDNLSVYILMDDFLMMSDLRSRTLQNDTLRLRTQIANSVVIPITQFHPIQRGWF